jgi:translation initiation factor 3 subunit M
LIAAYNLLIHIVRQAQNPEIFIARISLNLTTPITSSPANGAGLQLELLSTLFNTVPPSAVARYHILLAILRVIRTSSNFEVLKPQLKNLDSWLKEWDVDEEDERRLFLALTDVASEAGESDLAYQYLVRAIRTIPSDEASSPEAQHLSLRALKTALTHPSHFDFEDLNSLDSIIDLKNSNPTYFELLEIFTSETLDEFNDFNESHSGWMEKERLDADALHRKMRLLTLCSLAASAHQTRSLPYSEIAMALQIPAEDVEMWVIDVIRAGLVEGKLSQLNQTFLIHRCTYRVFGENQWREVDVRLNTWKNSLRGVLEVIRQQKAEFAIQKDQEAREMEAKVNGATSGGGGGYRNRGPRADQVPRLVETDAD